MGTFLEELHEQHKARQNRIRQAAFKDLTEPQSEPEPGPHLPEPEHEREVNEEPVELPIENRPVFDIILDEVCAYYSVRKIDLFSNRRRRNIFVQRHMLIYMVYRLTNWSCYKIGQKVDRDPSSVGYALNKIMDHIDQYEEQITQLHDRIAPLLARKKASLFQT